MKYFKCLVIILIMTTAVSCVNQQDENKSITLTGQILNPNTDFVILTINSVPEDRVLDTVYLDDTGLFLIQIPIEGCSPARFYDGKESTSLYLSPGDSLHIELNAEQFDESLQYTGKGAAKNNFLAQYYLKFCDYGKEDFIDFYMLRDTTVQAYLEIVHEDELARKRYLDQNRLENDYPIEFVEYMNTWIHFNKMEYFIYMFYNGGSLATSKADSQHVSQVKTHIINGIEYNDPDYLAPGYQWWLYAILPHVLSMDMIDKDENLKTNNAKRDSVLYSRMANMLTPFELQLAIYNEMRDYGLSYDLGNMEKLGPIVSEYVNDPLFRKPIDSLIVSVTEKLEQTIPEETKIYDLDNPILSGITFDEVLESYSGNVIYMDFWASWCGPCKGEMPYSAELSSQFQNENVVFLYVSTDRDSVAWKDMIKIMQLEGIHYRLGENTRKDVFERFGIEFIPHYVLFDQDGNMVKNNMTRPSESETEIQIRELILK